MIDSFPYDSWLNEAGDLNTNITTFWTFGPGVDHDLVGTYTLTALGMLAMVIALLWWVIQEDRKMKEFAGRLRDVGR